MADFTMDRFSLKGKTALVTGAERGIGLEIAKGLAAACASTRSAPALPTRRSRPDG